jgi:hypothetical protein
MSGYSPEMKPLLWPPAFEAQANAEGWTLHVAGTLVEVDLIPPRSRDEPIYHHLIAWIVFNAYGLGSTLHRTAWEFEYAANVEIYNEGRVPGDGMFKAYDDETGEVRWVSDDDTLPPFESDVRYSG